ncbi:MAG: hypothetical protein AAF789_11610 [Bacteroidota bacterium]
MTELTLSNVVMESIKAPELSSLGETAVQKFLRQREIYERQVKTLQASNEGIKLKPIEETLSKGLLGMLALTHGNGKPWTALTSQDLQEILKKIAGMHDLEDKSSVRDVLRRLGRMNTSMSSAKDRVNDQFRRLYEYIHDHGILSEFYHDEKWIDGPAEVFSNAMVHGAWPDSLKSEIQSEIAFNKELLKNPSELFKTMINLASGHDRWIGQKRERHKDVHVQQVPRKKKRFTVQRKPRPTSHHKSPNVPESTCGYCHKKGHEAKDCWAKDPSKRPEWLKNKLEMNSRHDARTQRNPRSGQKSATMRDKSE